MTQLWRPFQPHFLVYQNEEIAPNPVAFTIHYVPHKDHKNNSGTFETIKVPIRGYASQAHMGLPLYIVSQIISIISS